MKDYVPQDQGCGVMDKLEVHLEVRWTQLDDDKLHLVDKENIMNELGSD